MAMPAELQKAKERVRATVEGWVLKSIESTYAATRVRIAARTSIETI